MNLKGMRLRLQSGRHSTIQRSRLGCKRASPTAAKVDFKLEQLLWVLTVSQIEASFVFVKSLQNSIARSVAQSQQIAKAKIQKMAPSLSSIVDSDSPRKTSVSNHNSNSGFFNLFRVHDVIETSYLVCIAKMELHFCEEGCTG